MKSKAPLIVSVALNVVLVALLLRPRPAPEIEPGGGDTTGSSSAVTSASKPADVAAAPPAETVTNVVVRQFNWQSVESPDYREYIANLRAIGCPEETIRDIIRADVNKLYDEKRKQVRGEPKKFEYWKTGNPMAAFLGDSETMQKMRALEEEKNGVLRALGIEPDPLSAMMSMAGANPMEAMFDFLPEGKRTALMQTMADFQSKLVEGAGDIATDPEAMMKVQREMEQAIKAQLTPVEFLDYQLRFSTTANMMRMQLAGFEPNEEEFLEVFKLRAAHDEQFSPMGMINATEAEQKERREAEKLLNESIKQVLGETRYAEYERAQDFQYQQLARIVRNAELDTGVANQVYDMKKIAEQQASRVRSDSSLTAEQRRAALTAIRAETERSLQETMGAKGWDLYNRPGNIHWLRGIAPSEKPGSP